ncbi:MAG: hypothetical protein HYZ66_01320 [Chlamydiae bacterium]|nr:hypothetical protein [Chlamydiota bacterium]
MSPTPSATPIQGSPSPTLAPDRDGDGLTDAEEAELGTNPEKADTDGDGLDDGEEVNTYGTDPLNSDSDGDQMPDGWEVENDLLPNEPDASEDVDDDGLTNVEEYENETDPNNEDTDNDGLKDGFELNEYGTDPVLADTDDDNLVDGEEQANGTDPFLQDTDGDDLDDWYEIYFYSQFHTGSHYYPVDPLDADTDDDGMKDGYEAKYGFDYCDSDDGGYDTDNDGVKNRDEASNATDPLWDDTDLDGDGLSDAWEAAYGVFDPDSDDDLDGVPASEEYKQALNPIKPDSDSDGISDRFELDYKLDPRYNDASLDPDGDGFTSLQEYQSGTDPRDPNSHPSLAKAKGESDNKGSLIVPSSKGSGGGTPSGKIQIFGLGAVLSLLFAGAILALITVPSLQVILLPLLPLIFIASKSFRRMPKFARATLLSLALLFMSHFAQAQSSTPAPTPAPSPVVEAAPAPGAPGSATAASAPVAKPDATAQAQDQKNPPLTFTLQAGTPVGAFGLSSFDFGFDSLPLRRIRLSLHGGRGLVNPMGSLFDVNSPVFSDYLRPQGLADLQLLQVPYSDIYGHGVIDFGLERLRLRMMFGLDVLSDSYLDGVHPYFGTEIGREFRKSLKGRHRVLVIDVNGRLIYQKVNGGFYGLPFDASELSINAAAEDWILKDLKDNKDKIIMRTGVRYAFYPDSYFQTWLASGGNDVLQHRFLNPLYLGWTGLLEVDQDGRGGLVIRSISDPLFSVQPYARFDKKSWGIQLGLNFFALSFSRELIFPSLGTDGRVTHHWGDLSLYGAPVLEGWYTRDNHRINFAFQGQSLPIPALPVSDGDLSARGNVSYEIISSNPALPPWYVEAGYGYFSPIGAWRLSTRVGTGAPNAPPSLVGGPLQATFQLSFTPGSGVRRTGPVSTPTAEIRTISIPPKEENAKSGEFTHDQVELVQLKCERLWARVKDTFSKSVSGDVQSEDLALRLKAIVQARQLNFIQTDDEAREMILKVLEALEITQKLSSDGFFYDSYRVNETATRTSDATSTQTNTDIAFGLITVMNYLISVDSNNSILLGRAKKIFNAQNFYALRRSLLSDHGENPYNLLVVLLEQIQAKPEQYNPDWIGLLHTPSGPPSLETLQMILISGLNDLSPAWEVYAHGIAKALLKSASFNDEDASLTLRLSPDGSVMRLRKVNAADFKNPLRGLFALGEVLAKSKGTSNIRTAGQELLSFLIREGTQDRLRPILELPLAQQPDSRTNGSNAITFFNRLSLVNTPIADAPSGQRPIVEFKTNYSDSEKGQVRRIGYVFNSGMKAGAQAGLKYTLLSDVDLSNYPYFNFTRKLGPNSDISEIVIIIKDGNGVERTVSLGCDQWEGESIALYPSAKSVEIFVVLKNDATRKIEGSFLIEGESLSQNPLHRVLIPPAAVTLTLSPAGGSPALAESAVVTPGAAASSEPKVAPAAPSPIPAASAQATSADKAPLTAEDIDSVRGKFKSGFRDIKSWVDTLAVFRGPVASSDLANALMAAVWYARSQPLEKTQAEAMMENIDKILTPLERDSFTKFFYNKYKREGNKLVKVSESTSLRSNVLMAVAFMSTMEYLREIDPSNYRTSPLYKSLHEKLLSIKFLKLSAQNNDPNPYFRLSALLQSLLEGDEVDLSRIWQAFPENPTPDQLREMLEVETLLEIARLSPEGWGNFWDARAGDWVQSKSRKKREISLTLALRPEKSAKILSSETWDIFGTASKDFFLTVAQGSAALSGGYTPRSVSRDIESFWRNENAAQWQKVVAFLETHPPAAAVAPAASSPKTSPRKAPGKKGTGKPKRIGGRLLPRTGKKGGRKSDDRKLSDWLSKFLRNKGDVQTNYFGDNPSVNDILWQIGIASNAYFRFHPEASRDEVTDQLAQIIVARRNGLNGKPVSLDLEARRIVAEARLDERVKGLQNSLIDNTRNGKDAYVVGTHGQGSVSVLGAEWGTAGDEERDASAYGRATHQFAVSEARYVPWGVARWVLQDRLASFQNRVIQIVSGFFSKAEQPTLLSVDIDVLLNNREGIEPAKALAALRSENSAVVIVSRTRSQSELETLVRSKNLGIDLSRVLSLQGENSKKALDKKATELLSGKSNVQHLLIAHQDNQTSYDEIRSVFEKIRYGRELLSLLIAICVGDPNALRDAILELNKKDVIKFKTGELNELLADSERVKPISAEESLRKSIHQFGDNAEITHLRNVQM